MFGSLKSNDLNFLYVCMFVCFFGNCRFFKIVENWHNYFNVFSITFDNAFGEAVITNTSLLRDRRKNDRP